jgi:insulysin
MLTTAFEKKALRKILENITFEDFVKQSEHWLKSARYVWFVHGNLSKDQAINLVEKAREILNPKTIAKEDLVDVRCIALPPGKNLLIERDLEDTTNENNCLISYFEVGLEGTDIHTKMLHWVAMQFLDEPTFNQLRTIEQLGYVVVARKTDYRDVMGAQFLIQSPKESSEYIVNSLNNFLNSIKDKVAALTEEEFKV